MLLLSLLKPLQAEEKYTELKQGEPAPYAGVLLTKEAIAKIYTDQQSKIDILKIEHDYELKEKDLSWQTQYDLLETKYKLNESMYKSMIENRDNAIKTAPAHRQSLKTEWSFVGGILIGAGITIGIAYSLDNLPSQ